MNTTKVKTHLKRAAFSFGLLCLAIGVIPLALGQRHSSKNSKKSVAPAGVICPTQWQLVANMPLDLYGAAGASDGTFSYHAGGYSFSVPGTVDVFNKYDPVADTWTPLAPMATGTAMMASAVYYPTTNKIYVFGGEDGDTGVNYNFTRIYDIATNTWSAGAPMPDVRSFMAAGYNSANGKIYLATGYNTGFVDSAQPNTWEYDPVADTWNDLTGTAPFPHPVGGAASGVINGHLYVAGGRDAANTIVNNTFDYDIAGNTWTQRADMSAADQNNVPGSAVALDKLWVFGGGNPFIAAGATKGASPSTKAAFAKAFVKGVKGQSIPATANTTRFYNPPPDDTWSSFSSNMNSVRSFPSGAAIVDKLVCAGGYDGFGTVTSAETLDTCLPTPTPPQCDTGVILNGGFETGDFTSWVIDGNLNPPVVTTDQAHSGTFSALAGNVTGPEPLGDSSFYQQFVVPAGTSTLSFWHWDFTTDSITFDWQDAYITDGSGNILQTVFHQCLNGNAWINQAVDMTPYAGQTVWIKFLVHQDAFGDDTGMYVDDVQLTIPCGSPTPTPTPTVTPTPTPTPTPAISLSAHGRRVQGRHTVDLVWSGATSANIDVYRDGVVIATVPNNGSYKDFIGVRGGNVRYTYKVCEAGTGNCSNEVIVRFGGPPL